MAYYLIRVGEGSKYVDEAYEKSFVAIGWNEVPDLSKFESAEQVKSVLKEANRSYTDTQIAINAGQIFRFGILINGGDIILSPLSKGKYLVGGEGRGVKSPLGSSIRLQMFN